jgi:transcriptional regulator with PAS, ATPase and Fis domain
VGAHAADGTRLIGLLEPAQLSVQSHHLVMVRGPEEGRVWPLGETAKIGKGSDNDVVIVDATVSRCHFTLERRPEGYLLRDPGSTNGTFVDSTRVVEAYVKPGTEIRAGEVVLRLKPVYEGVQISPSFSSTFGALVGDSAPMRRIFALLERVAPTEATILVVGETGTGKGAVARAIHEKSHRAEGPLVTIDCGAISKSLIESELFGHEKGAFTGASQLRRGALETCRGGTLFIDELDDLPLELQPKLLRALDEREIVRVGSSKTIKLDLRVVAATKKDLRVEVAEGRFREDLYYRLSIVTIPLPPLRERLEDLPLLTARFLEDAGAWEKLPKKFREKLSSHAFPGNVRELRNLLERASYLEGFDALDRGDFPFEHKGPEEAPEFKLTCDFTKPFKEAKEALVERFEREYLKRLLGRNSNKMSRAAKEAQIDRKYLYMLLSKHRLASGEE